MFELVCVNFFVWDNFSTIFALNLQFVQKGRRDCAYLLPTKVSLLVYAVSIWTLSQAIFVFSYWGWRMYTSVTKIDLATWTLKWVSEHTFADATKDALEVFRDYFSIFYSTFGQIILADGVNTWTSMTFYKFLPCHLLVTKHAPHQSQRT